jgi:NAD(P)-dependent dehydrogenase (short-subunit alcohol dehydrogenase family)
MHVVVFGANRGIGLEFCKRYKDSGFKVTAICRTSSDALNQVADIVYTSVDATNLNKIKEISEKIDEVDMLVHVAGILRDESLEEMNFGTIGEQMAVNAMGPLMSIMGLLPRIKAGGKIAVLTSRMGSIADNSSGGRYGYRMSKAALNAAMKSLSIDLKDKDIAVGILHPGYVRTDMTGGNGLIDTGESVWGMMKVLEKLDMDNTGTFWHMNGEELPW